MPRRPYSRPKISLFAFQDIITGVTGVMILVALLMALEVVRTASRLAEVADDRLEVEEFEYSSEELARQNEVLRDELAKLLLKVKKLQEFPPEKIKELQAELEKAERRRSELAKTHQAATSTLAETSKSLLEKLVRLKRERAELIQELERMRAREKTLVGQHGRIARFRAESPGLWWVFDIKGNGWYGWQIDHAGVPTGMRREFTERTIGQRLQAFKTWLSARPKGVERFFFFVRPSGIEGFDAVRDYLRDNGYPLGFDLLGNTQRLELVNDL